MLEDVIENALIRIWPAKTCLFNECNAKTQVRTHNENRH